MTLNETEKQNILKGGMILLVLVSVFLIVEIAQGFKKYNTIGRNNVETIAVSGEGEVFAVPDIARITYSIRESAKNVKDAQTAVSKKTDSTLSALREMGIEDKDIKTLSYNSYPKYEWQEGRASCLAIGCPPSTPGKQVIVGYEVSQTIEVKVRDTEQAPSVLEKLGSLSVSDISGPDFSIDDPDALNEEARQAAIDDAKEKAEVLERQLGIRLGRIVSFSESGNYPPIYYAKDMLQSRAENAAGSAAPMPSLPAGENKIISNVTVVYEIR